MDDYLKKRFRVIGVVTILIVAIFFIVLLFVQFREKKNTSIRLRVFYSEIVQALLISKNSNGVPSEWGWKPGYKNKDLLTNYFFNYLKVEESCVDNPGKCIPKENYLSIKENKTNVNIYNFPSVKLKNGISIAVETVSKCKKKNSVCAIVYTDLNGVEEPNAFGKDLFVFVIINSGTVAFQPYNYSWTVDQLRYDTNYGCNKFSKAAMSCAALISKNNWNIDSKYPW